MGSKPRDSGTMSSASSGAQAADQQLASNAKQNQDFMNAARAKLFGSANGSGDFSGGTLSKFLDPNSLNVDQPSGVYGLQYKQAVGNIAKQSQDVRGSISRYNASRGFGNAPAGFAQDQERRAAEDQVGQQGAAFSDYAGKSYQDALQNFWRASGSLSGEGDSALSASIAGDSAAANNYANLYGTASTPRPSALGSIIGAGLQTGGQIGAAALGPGGAATTAAACPCEGALLLGMDGEERPIQDWRKGEELMGIDGRPCALLDDPRPVMRDCVKITALNGHSRVSVEHTFALPVGGYEFAFKSNALNVRFKDSITTVLDVEDIGKQMVYALEIGGSHSYRADGFWGLS